MLDNACVRGNFELFGILVQEGHPLTSRDNSNERLSSVYNYIQKQNQTLECLRMGQTRAPKNTIESLSEWKLSLLIAKVIVPWQTDYGVESKTTRMIKSKEKISMNRLK